jgi:hypothetical protein
MKRFAPSGWALGMSVGLAFLAGCCGSQPPIGAPGAPAHGPTATEARPLLRGSYLYVGVCCGALNNGGVKVYDPGQTKVQRRIVRGLPIRSPSPSTGNPRSMSSTSPRVVQKVFQSPSLTVEAASLREGSPVFIGRRL